MEDQVEVYDPSPCCEGETFYLLCEDDNCPAIHQFAICEICGKDNSLLKEALNCSRPDGFKYEEGKADG